MTGALSAKLGVAAALLVWLLAPAEASRSVSAPALAGFSVASDAGLVLAQATPRTQEGQARGAGDTQLSPSESDKSGNRLTWFFAIGMVINVIVLGAFLVWAFKQWKRT